MKTPPERRQVSATVAGHILDDLKFVHSKYHTGEKLGMALPTCIQLAAKYLREKSPQVPLPNLEQEPLSNVQEAQELIKKIQSDPLLQPKPPEPKPQDQEPDWDRGDPLPQFMAPETPRSEPSTSEPKTPEPIKGTGSTLLDKFLAGQVTGPQIQRPPPIILNQHRPQELHDIPEKCKLPLLKAYILNNRYHEKGTEDDKRISGAWIMQCLRGYVPDGLAALNHQFENKVLKLKNHERWFTKNPRFPQADKYIWDDSAAGTALKNFEI